MSSILKALRKLEEEKGQGLEGSPDIARNILKIGPRRNRSPWMLVAFVTVLVFASSVTGYFLAEKKTHIPFLSPEASRALTERPPAKVPPSAEDPAPPSNLQPLQSRGGETKSESPPSPPEKDKASATSLPQSPAVERTVRKPVTSPPPSPTPPRPAKRKAVDPLPSLSLTGIALQDEGVGRLAVVNNLPVMEGSVIEGATVMEISSDRVRFDLSGRSFEVLLDDPAARK